MKYGQGLHVGVSKWGICCCCKPNIKFVTVVTPGTKWMAWMLTEYCMERMFCSAVNEKRGKNLYRHKEKKNIVLEKQNRKH